MVYPCDSDRAEAIFFSHACHSRAATHLHLLWFGQIFRLESHIEGATLVISMGLGQVNSYIGSLWVEISSNSVSGKSQQSFAVGL